MSTAAYNAFRISFTPSEVSHAFPHREKQLENGAEMFNGLLDIYRVLFRFMLISSFSQDFESKARNEKVFEQQKV